MRFCLVSPAFGRFHVTRLALAQRAWMASVLAERGHQVSSVIVADDRNLDIAEDYGFDTLEFPNDIGLGAKFNAGFKYALEVRNADYVVHIGSDDWVHPDFFDAFPLPADVGKPMPVPGKVVVKTAGPPTLVACSMAIVNLSDGTGLKFKKRRPWGVIPWAIPAVAFENKRFPIAPEKLKGMEWHLMEGLGPLSWIESPHPLPGVDFKSSLNITPYKGLRSFAEAIDPWAELAMHYPAHLVEMAQETSDLEMAA